MEFLFDWLIKS